MKGRFPQRSNYQVTVLQIRRCVRDNFPYDSFKMYVVTHHASCQGGSNEGSQLTFLLRNK